jgi:hypothetical protein
MFRTRRVLFSFIALALVLVAAIATSFYLGATTRWQPQDPLRFCLVDTPGPRELITGLSGPRSVESIMVENTSAVPIHLISMWVADADGARITLAVEPAPARESLGATSGVIVVPAHGSVYATSTVPITCITTGARDSLRMNFLWQTDIKSLTSSACEWLHDHSPPALQAHIPGLPASLQHAPISWLTHANANANADTKANAIASAGTAP